MPAASKTRLVALLAIAAAVVGVFATWTTDRTVDLTGVQGPNNGWLVLIVAVFALAWTPALTRGSWVGIVGVLGASIVMGWTAVGNWLDSRDVYGASASFGLLLVLAGSVGLAGVAVARGLTVLRRP